MQVLQPLPGNDCTWNAKRRVSEAELQQQTEYKQDVNLVTGT